MKYRKDRIHISSRLLILLVPAVILTGCQGREIESQWAAGAITIDGDMSEWPDSNTTYLNKEKALVGISNDGENLYLLFRFGEPAWLTTMAMGDLTVWVSTSGKRTRDLGFRYSGGVDPSSAMRAPGGRESSGGRISTGGDRTGQRSGGNRAIEPPTLNVIKGNAVISISLNGAVGPAARSSMLDRIFTLELKIPLSAGTGDWYGIDIRPGEMATLGFELMIDEEHIQDMGQRGVSVGMVPGGAGGRGGGMGGRGGGMGGDKGGGRGGGTGGSTGGVTMPQEHKIWIQTLLAEPPR